MINVLVIEPPFVKCDVCYVIPSIHIKTSKTHEGSNREEYCWRSERD